MVHHAADRIREVLGWVKVELVVLGSVALHNTTDVVTLIEAPAAECYGKGPQAGGAGVLGIVEDGGRIDASAQPNSKRYIGERLLGDGLIQQRVQLISGLFGPHVGKFSWTEFPVRLAVRFPVDPFQYVPGRKFLDVLQQR